MASIIKSKTVKTRKKHNCFGCGREFPKGSKLKSTTYADDFEGIRTLYWCDVCLEYWGSFMVDDDEIMFGELKSERKDDWEKVRKKVEG